MRFITLLLISFSSFSLIWGQAPVLIGDQLPCGCAGLFQDSGGAANDYKANEMLSSVLCPDFCTSPVTGTHAQLVFSDIDLKEGDALSFYNGNDTNAPLLLKATDRLNGYPFIVQATATNPSGCLTIQFESNGIDQGEGWNAAMNCIPACQLIQAELTNTSPAADASENGYINVCIGDEITFNGRGLYPEAGEIYDHSDATSTFMWDFGDGAIAVGKDVRHAYQKSGGYKVELTITDQFGCQSSNFITQRVRVSTKPHFEILDNFPSEVCVGDTITLRGGVMSDSSNISVSPTLGYFQSNGIRSDSLPLPDGNGRSYETSVSFKDFRPGQLLTNLDDLESICLNIEHSWLHDMEISITCPSGRSVILQDQQPINDKVYLGIPVDGDGIDAITGEGKNYCWIPNEQLTLTDVARLDNNSAIGEPFLLPEGNYKSNGPLSTLVGCPLNGEWTIKVTDLWEQDNGWIFSWGIQFDPSLFPNLDSFEADIVSIKWLDDQTIVQKTPAINPHTVLAVPDVPTLPGEKKTYQFSVEDSYGCPSDTSIQITVLPVGHKDCLTCETDLFFQSAVTACEGDVLQLGAYLRPEALEATSFNKNTNFDFYREKGFIDTLNISGFNGQTISNDLEELTAICVDLETDKAEDISIQLRGPKGQSITLVSSNGITGKGVQNFCFNPKAVVEIDKAIPPYAGVYLPQNDWQSLVGESINGEWVLIASSLSGSTVNNVIKSWSLSFNQTSNSTYRWIAPRTNLNASSGANPTLTANANTEPFYVLEKETAEGCVTADTLHINLLATNIPMTVTHSSLANGEVFFYWESVPGAIGYEVSRDGIAWRPTDDDFFHRERGFTNGEEATVLFRAIYEGQVCATDPTNVFFRHIFCDLEASLLAAVPEVACYGDQNRSATIDVSGGDAPYTYKLDDLPTQTDPTFNNLGAGNYEVLISDRDNVCADTVQFSIGTIDSLGVVFDSIAPTCFNLQDGQIIANPFGGVGGNTFNWSRNQEITSAISNVATGTYRVTVTDGNGCSVVDEQMIEAPSQLELTPTASPVSCNGGDDGLASVKVKGGTPFDNEPFYRYTWDDNQTSSEASDKRIGTYSVTVTDANQCTAIASTEVKEPPVLALQLEVDSISCVGNEDGRIIASATGGTPNEQSEGYDFKWDNGQFGRQNILLKEDTYTVTVSDAKGCSLTRSQVISPANPIIISEDLIEEPTCNGASDGRIAVRVSGGAGNYEYLWNDDQQQTSFEARNITAGIYKIKITDENACADSLSITISEPARISTIQNSQAATCHDRADGIAIVRGMNGSGTYTVDWGDGRITDTLKNLLPGRYPFTITDQQTCSLLDTVLVGSPDTLQYDTISITTPSCFNGTNGVIEAFPIGGTAPYSFRLNNIDVQNPITDARQGTFNLEVVDRNGCMAFKEFILVPPPDLAYFPKVDHVVCTGAATGQAVISPEGGVPPYSYQWSDAATTRDSIISNLLAGEYRVTVTDANGCQTSDLITILEPEESLKIDSITQLKVACFESNQGEAMVHASGGSGTDYQYNWSAQNQNNAIAKELLATTYFVTVTDENGCTAMNSIDIEELDAIEVQAIGVSPKCFGLNDGKLAASDPLGGAGAPYNYRWSNNERTQLIENLTGNITYILTVTDQQNCSAVVETFLREPEEILIDATVDSLDCHRDNSGRIQINSLSNGSTITNYNWDYPNGDPTNNSLTNLPIGTYNVTLTNSDNCAINASYEIFEPNPLALENRQLTNPICSNDQSGSIELSISGGTLPYRYNWSTGDQSKDLLNTNGGDYQVTISDANNCSITENLTLSSPSAVTGSIETDSIICFGDRNGRIDINPSGGLPPYKYSLDGSSYKSSNTFIGLTAGNYTTYVKDINGCIWETSNVKIDQASEFSVEIASDVSSIILGDSTIIAAHYTNNKGTVQLDWGPNIDCLQENCERIVVKPQSSTKFEVYAVDEAGCEAEADFFLRTTNPKKVLVPSGFSPNNDGFNDILLIHGQSNITVLYFHIYDRWGEEIYTARNFNVNDSNIGWDGTFRGQVLNGGVYTWVMEVAYLDGQKEIFKGNTTLIK